MLSLRTLNLMIDMNSFNVLFIASSRRWGLSFNFARLAIALREAGHKVVVVSEPQEEEKGLLKELKLRGIKHFTLSGLDTLSIKNTVVAARTMGGIIDRYDIDIIHAQGTRQSIVAFLASKMFCRKEKISVVVSIHTTLADRPYKNATLLVESFLLNICSDLAVPVARSVANELVAFGLNPSKVKPVYNGIDLELIDSVISDDVSPPLIPEDFKRPSIILVGYFARLAPKKGHRYLISAISKISKEFPNIRLLIAGDGPLRDALENLSKELNIEEKVLFTGRIRHESVYKLLKRVDIYAFPSLAELFPYAILEAMAAGKPIVSTSVGGVLEVIKNGETGLLVSPGNSDELAEGLKILIRDPLKAKEMGKKCRKLIEEKFALHKIARDLTRCYELSIERKHHN